MSKLTFLFIAGIALLLMPRVPGIGAQTNGAFLQIKVGPISFQPAEFAKIAIIIFLASYLRDTRQLLVIGARRFVGITLPPLKYLGPDVWSRRITQEHRCVYLIKSDRVEFLQGRYHY